MKRVIALSCLAAGALGSAFGLYWYLAVLIELHATWPFPTEIASIEGLFAIWGAVMLATFYRNPRPIWQPLLRLTGQRVKIARLLLMGLVLNSLVWVIALLSLLLFRVREPVPWVFCALASSCMLLNGCYVWIHWAFRPENLFTERFRRFADDPIVFTVFELLGRTRRIK